MATTWMATYAIMASVIATTLSMCIYTHTHHKACYMMISITVLAMFTG